MRQKLYTFILFLVIVTTDIALGKDGNKHKAHKINHKKQQHKDNIAGERTKRSLNDGRVPFWTNKGKKLAETINDVPEYHLTDKIRELTKEPPFWGARGRRDSSSSENYNDLDYTDEYGISDQHLNKCIECPNTDHKVSNKYWKGRRDEMSPFWGNRGRRQADEDNTFEPFWGNRGKRQESEPFWGNRGKKEDEPFWGNRGKKENEPFWGNRGRRDDEPFWGNRGRREDLDPFWGNRGRRQDNEPFWGNRGRREDEPFWGNRGRRKVESIRGAKNTQKEQLTETILMNIKNVENDIKSLSRLQRSPNTNFWMNRGRDSKLKYLLNGPRNRLDVSYVSNLKSPIANTVHDDRIFADEPHYILLERSSRSSGEDDPFFISRGKKYHFKYKAARDRRGALEEIVKSVRNDPYYIARGKKDDVKDEKINPTEGYLKAKELICSAIDLMMEKNENVKVKRETDENDRDRRTILKKLAANLKMDPYFVSRGKRNNTNNNEIYLADFISDVADKCN